LTSFPELLDLLPQNDGRRGHEFERLAKWFMENDPSLKSEYNRVWRWTEWPLAWAPDAGIDLVAARRDGSLVAVQVKCYAPNRLITKRDMDTFLSESSRPVFAERLLIATCDGLGRTAARTVEGQEKPVRTVFYDYLDRSPVDWPSDLTALRPSLPEGKEPRPHQRRAVTDVVEAFRKADRGQLVMACGTGKTLTCLWVAEGLGSTRTLVLVPSLSLMSQTVREWTVNDARGFEFIAVCSDETVVDNDAQVAHTRDLPFTGVTSDPTEIAAFLRRRGPRVVFSTYQSSPRVAEAQASSRAPWFDLAVADEAHRCAGSPDAAFATILDPAAIKAKRRLFTTATPRVATGRLKRAVDDLDLEVASMDDQAKFGRVFHRLSFAEAIERGLLSDYRVAIVVVDDATVRDYVSRGVFLALADGTVRDARTLGSQVGLLKAMRKFGLRRVLSFHSRVNSAAGFASTLPDLLPLVPARERPSGHVWSHHVSGVMPSGQRDRLLRRLRDVGPRERGVLTNARCLTEGVDVPALDGVAFIDPRRSQVDVVQAVGRAIRTSDDKTKGTIVLPVFIPSIGGDPEAMLDRSVFQPVVEVLRALRDHDEVLAEQLDALRREIGYRGTVARLPSRIYVDVPRRLGSDFFDLLRVRTVELSTSQWEESFGRLQRFVEREGHSRPAAQQVEDGYSLGMWVAGQRNRQATLSAVRQERLEALPGWTWDVSGSRWSEAFDHLTAFAIEHGNATVPQGFVTADGFHLGSWVSIQRVLHRRGSLSNEKVALLEAEPGWTWRPHESRWQQGFGRLRAYVDESGSADVPQDFVDAEGFALGRWVTKQRSAQARGRLELGRRELLAAMPGWRWSILDEAWTDGFTRLRRYVDQHGNPLVPTAFVDDDGFRLGAWVHNQVTWKTQGRMGTDRQAALEGLPGWDWDGVLDGRWSLAFERLKAYVAQHGTSVVPISYREEDGFKLGMWVGNQRAWYQRGKMPPDREAKLATLPGWQWVARG
jgi:superfamily II DNA or RNA helicase